MNADGSGKIQMTDGGGEQKPNVSADGKWLFYQVPGNAPTTIWKVSTDGGEAVQVTKDYGTNPSVSPDGKLLAYFKRKEPAKEVLEIAVMSLETEQIVKVFALPDGDFIGTSKILWAKDERALIYTRERIDRIANLWVQPLDGAAAKQITNYSSEQIFDFGFSPDGEHLAVIRGSWKNEAFLISGFK
jgi:eukaryotic-like serine/threonine-protein kinase